jgi:hypothetical protein
MCVLVLRLFSDSFVGCSVTVHPTQGSGVSLFLFLACPLLGAEHIHERARECYYFPDVSTDADGLKDPPHREMAVE